MQFHKYGAAYIQLRHALTKHLRELRAELRNETIACIALTDLRGSRALDVRLDPSWILDFDEALRRYAWVNSDGTATIRDVATDAEIAALPSIGGHSFVMMSPDGQYVAQVSDAEGAKVWSLTGRKPTLVTPVERGWYCNFSPDSRLFAAGPQNGMLTFSRPASCLYWLPNWPWKPRLTS